MTKSSLVAGRESAFTTHPLKFKHFHEFVVASALAGIVRTLSPRQVHSLAKVLGNFVARRWHSRRQIAQKNIRLAFPLLNAAEIDLISAHVFQQSAKSFLEFSRMSQRTEPELLAHVEVSSEAREYFRKKDSPVIYVSAHLGNWEFLGRWLATCHGPIALLINPQTNPLVDRMIMKWRAHPRLFFVPYANGWHALNEMLQSGVSVALLADQRLDRGGVKLPFFGCSTSWSKLPALLAVKHQIPMLPIFLPRISDESFRLTIGNEIVPSGTTDIHAQTIRLTSRYIAACEQVIRDYPSQYLFTHNRWRIEKSSPKESESPHVLHHGIPVARQQTSSSRLSLP